MTEQRLEGGRTLGAVRSGDTIRKPTRPWTPAVHAVLRHLEEHGFDGAPRVLGVDDEGREMLTYLSGSTVGEHRPWPDEIRGDRMLVQVGAWLRRLHDATGSFVPPPDAVWMAGQSWQPGVVIGHNDAAPYNVVWDERGLVGFVDWDTAGPATRDIDLAFAALWWVPLHLPRVVAETGFTTPGDRRRRLHLFLDAYGYPHDRAGFRAAVVDRVRINATVIRRFADAGDPTYVTLLATAVDLDEAATAIEALPASFWIRDSTDTVRL